MVNIRSDPVPDIKPVAYPLIIQLIFTTASKKKWAFYISAVCTEFKMSLRYYPKNEIKR